MFELTVPDLYFNKIKFIKLLTDLAKPGWLRQLACIAPHSTCSLGFKSYHYLYTCASIWIKWLGCHAGHWPCWSAVVAPEVNPLQTGDETWGWGIHPGFETQSRCHQTFRSISGTTSRTNVLQEFRSIWKKKTDLLKDWIRVTCLDVSHPYYYTKMFSVLVWECKCIFIHT